MEDDYVSQIEVGSIAIVARTPSNIRAIKGMGGMADSTTADTWRIDYDTEDQLATVLQFLRDTGLAFAGGSTGWPPSAVAAMLRDRGKFSGIVREAVWLGPNQQIVQDR